MKLLNLKYKSIFQNDWTLEEFDLNPKVNLIVAQNATGKSRTIKTIAFISQLLKDLNMII